MLRKLSWMAVAGAVAACGGEPGPQGVAGPQGYNSLVRLDAVDAGAKCANGGSG